MGKEPEIKSMRTLMIYARLSAGEMPSKAALAGEYGVTERSIQRDMETLRAFFVEQHLGQDIVFDRMAQGYRLVNTIPKGLSNSEILAVCKILLDSRSMRRDEMMPLLDKLIDCCVPEESKRAVRRRPRGEPQGSGGTRGQREIPLCGAPPRKTNSPWTLGNRPGGPETACDGD